MRKIILIASLWMSGHAYSQAGLDQTKNYIYEKNCLTEDCSKKIENVQYFDGLGRLKQNISLKSTPNGKDIVVPVEYDTYGRQVRDYLAIPQTTALDGAIYADPLSNVNSVYGNEKIYAEKVLEASPLNKVLQQKSVGNEWASHPVNSSYAANTADEVKKYVLTTSWTEGRTNSILNLSGTYDPNTLLKSTITDEDGNTTLSFKNKKGQVVLIRRNDGSQNIDTHYVYDKYGNLAYSIPPLAAKSGLTDQTTLDNLCYQYRYDAWSRLVEKKIPGKGWEYMVYDKQSRLVLSQDINMRSQGQWIFTKYDQFSRPVYTGILDSPPGRTAQVTAVEGHGSNNEMRSTSGFSNSGTQIYYSDTAAYPTGNFKVLSVNYYDTYPSYSFNPPFPGTISGKPVLTDNSTGNNISTKGLQVMSLLKNIEDDHWTKSYIYYDLKGRAIGTYTVNHLGGYTNTETDLDFVGAIKKSVAKHKRLDTDTERTITQNFEYDAQNRLKKHYHQVDQFPQELLADHTYNELSQLTNKKVGGTSAVPLQSIDYRYNIKGWITKINDPANLSGKLFGYEMKYTGPSYSQIAPGKYNGSITEIDWKISTEDVIKRYTYSYDGLGRLKDGIYTEPATTAPYSNNYNESMTYDLIGNIKTLKRNGLLIFGPTATLVDDLTYEYNGNKLTKVIENALNDSGYEGGNNTIDYDLNGNMLNMKDKGIQQIGYNFLNLANIMSISQTNPFGNVTNFGMEYLYRADGTKLRKIHSTGGNKGNPATRNMTDYLDGFQYSMIESSSCTWCRTSVAYEQEAFSPMDSAPLESQWTLDLVPTSEGYYSFKENRYIYQYKDHLGNARVSFAKNSEGFLQVTDTNNYYPFGLNHIGGINRGNLGSYFNYKYAGKEIQETGFYDYGWRQYLPDLGKWNGIDQLSEQYITTSPYGYVANNPVSRVDFDGRWFNDDGTIDVSGHTPGFVTGKQYQQSFLGRTPDEGGGGGYTFSGKDAMSMFDYFANGGSIGALSFSNGEAIWWTGIKRQTTYNIAGDIHGEGEIGEMHRSTMSSNYEPSFFGDFIEGVTYADRSNFVSTSAFIGYGGLHLNKYEGLLKLGAKGGSISTLRQVSKNLKIVGQVGKYLGYLGVVASIGEDYSENKIGWGTVAKVGLGIALIYAGPVAIVYGVADLTWGIVTGTTITDRIASGIDNSRLGTDFNIFSELND